MIEYKSNIIKIESRKKIIYICILIAILILIFIFVAMNFLKYQVEGEKKLPFEITNMLIVSTADGIGKEDPNNRWNLSILQNNDIYIDIKNKSYNGKNDSIKKIVLENFTITNGPQEGEPKIYHPVNDKDLIYLYKDENLVYDKIEYNVAPTNNIKKLEIARNGGIVSFSSCSYNVATYISNDENEIKYDATLLNKVGINEEEVKYEINFDIIVEMESSKKYKSSINLNLPLDNLLQKGTIKMEIKDFSNIVFKRV